MERIGLLIQTSYATGNILEKAMPSISTLAEALVALAKPGMKSKDLLAAVRVQHTHATKKEAIRAAFSALTHGDLIDPDRAKELHDYALNERSSDDAEPFNRGKLRKKKDVRR